jgi:iron complex outermembrane receptor protein
MSRSSKFSVGASAVAIALCAFSAKAEAAAVEAQPGAQAGGESTSAPTGLGDIVVTARRKSENLQSVPISITAFTGAALQEQNIVSISALNSKVPSLQTSMASGDRNQVIFSLRGLTQTFGGSQPSVVTYFVDVPTVAAGPSLLFDIESLQVLKGPQGTLFGRNTTGGAILINPQRPGNTFGGYVDFSTGSYGLARAQGAVNIPLIDNKLLVRVAVDSNHRKGFTRDLALGKRLDNVNYTNARLSVIARPFDGFENYFVFDETHNYTNGTGVVFTDFNPAFFPTRLAAVQAVLDAQRSRGVRIVQHSTLQDFDRVKARAITDVATLDLSKNIKLKAIFGYRKYDQNFTSDTDGSSLSLVEELPSLDGSPSSGIFGSPGAFKSVTGELQLQGKSLSNKLSWTLGAYYEKTRPGSPTQIDRVLFFGAADFGLRALRYDRSRAIYGQASYDLSSLVDGLTFTGGVRYTKDDRKIVASTFIFLPSPTPPICFQIGANAACQRRQTTSFDAVTYNLDLEYKVAPRTLLYIATRKGYKSGGFNADVPDSGSTIFQPETVKDGEIGIKTDGTIGGAKFRLNAAYYRSKFNSIQIQQIFVDTISGLGYTTTGNGGKATIQGVELEGTLIPVPGLKFSGFYAYIDAKYNTPSLRNTDFSSVPKHKFGITGQYDFNLGNTGIVTPAVSYSYQTVSHYSNVPDARDLQPAYGLLEARLDWKGVAGSRLDLSVFGTNLTNKIYKAYGFNLYNKFGFNSAVFGEPRMYGVRGHYTF